MQNPLHTRNCLCTACAACTACTACTACAAYTLQVRAVDRTGRKIERPGLERESGLPKQHLTLTENAPAWDEAAKPSQTPLGTVAERGTCASSGRA